MTRASSFDLVMFSSFHEDGLLLLLCFTRRCDARTCCGFCEWPWVAAAGPVGFSHTLSPVSVLKKYVCPRDLDTFSTLQARKGSHPVSQRASQPQSNPDRWEQMEH